MKDFVVNLKMNVEVVYGECLVIDGHMHRIPKSWIQVGDHEPPNHEIINRTESDGDR